MTTRTRPSPLTTAPVPAALADWDVLFNAVTWRLRTTVSEPLPASDQLLLQAAVDSMRNRVLECVQALDQLHGMLAQQINRSAQLEQRVQTADAALARLHAELAGAPGQPSQRRASHDDLTALPNRRFFRERLDRAFTPAVGASAPPAVLYVALDGFQPINERHGHDVGDEILRIVAMRLSRAMRSEDVVSRLGGDEFACLLADAVSRQQLAHIACKLFDAVSSPLKVGSLQLSVRPSIGIAVGPQDGATAGALMRNADAAMDHAKRNQSGYAFFDSCAST